MISGARSARPFSLNAALLALRSTVHPAYADTCKQAGTLEDHVTANACSMPPQSIIWRNAGERVQTGQLFHLLQIQIPASELPENKSRQLTTLN